MSTTTSNLGLFKYDVNTDTNVAFSITKALNNNWDIIDEKCTGGGLEVCDIGMALYVDETQGLRRYLNGQIVDINANTQVFLNRLKEIQTTNPDYFTDETTWQSEATLNIDGCVYKFVLNYSGADVISVRLPKYPEYVEINAGGTLPVVGNGMALGMTDGTITKYTYQAVSGNNLWTRQPGYLTSKQGKVGDTTENVTEYLTDYKFIGMATDPTKSGVETTLKQTKLKMRYFIQIATGAETENNIINEIELNNPYSLFDSKYSDHELNNLSWLKSNGQWNAKAVYTDAYDKLLKVYNGVETVEGLSIKLSTETFTDYDFVLNTADETFRLPLKTKQKFYDNTAPVVGNGMDLGLTYGGSTLYGAGIGSITGSAGLLLSTTAGHRLNSTPPTTVTAINNLYSGLSAIGVTTDGTKSGIETHLTETTLYLYFYIGETVQNANLIDAGRIGEQLTNKQDKCIHIIDTYTNGTSGYRIWSDGYCEQWGTADNGSYVQYGTIVVNFLKVFKDANYNSLDMVTAYTNRDNHRGMMTTIHSKNTSTMSVAWYGINNVTLARYVSWKVSGYLAEGEY